MNEEQKFLFDNYGFLVLKNILNEEQIVGLRSTLKYATEQHAPDPERESPLHWSPYWRDLLDLPTISPLVEELVGNHELRDFRQNRNGESFTPTFRLDHINVHTHVKKGYKGMPLHGGWRSSGGSQFYRYHDGKFYNGLIVVAFELFDTHENDGGFCCLPGTHKSNVPLPEGWEVPGQIDASLVKRVPANAGDAIIFTETLIHGTLPWQVDSPRQTVFYKFSPHGTSWSSDYFKPEEYRCYPDMDDRKLAILEVPNARYGGRPTRPERINKL